MAAAALVTSNPTCKAHRTRCGRSRARAATVGSTRSGKPTTYESDLGVPASQVTRLRVRTSAFPVVWVTLYDVPAMALVPRQARSREHLTNYNPSQ